MAAIPSLAIQSDCELATQPSQVCSYYTDMDSLRFTNDFFRRIMIRAEIPGIMTDSDGIIHCNIIDFLLRKDLVVV